MWTSDSSQPQVIGLVGEASSGKEEIVKFLRTQGFVFYSLSDTLREIATILTLPHDRDVLVSLGNSLRQTFGPDLLAQSVHRSIENKGDLKVVVDSIRNPAELRYLQNEVNAFIIGISITPEKRFELMQYRRRPGDPETWDEFLDLIALEQGEGEESTGIQVKSCLELANITIDNNGTLEDLYARTLEVLELRQRLLEGNHSSSKER